MRKYENIIYKFIVVFLILSTIFSFLIIKKYNFDLTKYSYFLFIIGIVSLLLIIYGIIKKYHKFTIFELLIILLIIFGIISTVFAIDIEISLFGTQFRKEGLFVLITYYLLFLLSKNINKKEYILNIVHVLLLLGTFNVMYGLWQTVPFLNEYANVESPWIYASGTFGNSNFYGTFMLIELSLSLGLYFYQSKKYLFFVFLYTLGILLSGCMSCLLALLIIYILLIIYTILIKKIDYKKIIFTIFSLIISLFIVNSITESELIKDTNEFKNQINNSIKEGVKEEYGSSRIHIWTNTLKEVPNNLLNGVGIDNFMKAFNPPIRTLDYGLIVDKAHNEYLQKLLTEGIFSLITYLALLMLILIKGFKNIKKDSIFIPLLLVFIGYSVQAFFNISVTRVAPFFFIFSGILINNKIEEKV